MLIKNFDAIVAAVNHKLGDRPCSACGKSIGFLVQDQEFQALGFNRTQQGVDTNGKRIYVPCVTTICKNCGFVQMHALPLLMGDPDYVAHSLS